MRYIHALSSSFALVALTGCSSSPCEDYCASSMRRLIDCGILRGSAEVEEAEVDSCVAAIEQTQGATDEACEEAQRNFDASSCDSLADVFCGVSDPNVICERCPVDDRNPCTEDLCVDHVPVHRQLPAGTVPWEQEGDCMTIVCDGTGQLSVQNDDSDVADDGNPCTEDGCFDGNPFNAPKPRGAACDAERGFVCIDEVCRAPCTRRVTVPGASAEFDPDDGALYDVTAVDVNGDGMTDVVALSAATSLRVHLNTGSGTFAPPVEYSLGGGVTHLAMADLNGDGSVDAVATQANSSGLPILLNLGDGRFAAPGISPAGGGATAIAAADLNGDGRIDLATAGEPVGGDSRVNVLMNLGDGRWGPSSTFSTLQDPRSIVAADLDNDDRPDLVVTGRRGVGVYLNQGEGAFAAPVYRSSYATPEAVAVADLNGDGHADLAVPEYHGAGEISVLLGRGDGDFAPPVHYVAGAAPTKLLAQDLDGDGSLDLAAVSSLSTVSVLRNRGDGTFGAASVYSAGGGPGIAAADLDGDGMPELIAIAIVFDGLAASIDWLRNLGDGAFEPTSRRLARAVPLSIAAGHLAGGESDFLAVADHQRVLLLSDDGATALSVYKAGKNPGFALSADVSGDGKEELIVANAGSADVSVLVNFGRRNDLGDVIEYGAPVNHPVGDTPRSVATADLDGDGHVDIVAANEGSDSVSVLYGGGGASFALPVDHAAGARPRSVAAGDLDADGRPDLVVASHLGSTVNVLLNQGDRAFSAPVVHPVDAGPRAIALGDLDGDGALDLAVPSERGGSVGVLFNDGRGGFSAGTHYAAGVSPWAVAAADLDGDGTVDLAVANHGGAGDAGDVTLLHNTGNGTLAAPIHHAAGTNPTAIVAADLNNDGGMDVAVANETGSSLVTLLLTTCE